MRKIGLILTSAILCLSISFGISKQETIELSNLREDFIAYETNASSLFPYIAAVITGGTEEEDIPLPMLVSGEDDDLPAPYIAAVITGGTEEEDIPLPMLVSNEDDDLPAPYIAAVITGGTEEEDIPLPMLVSNEDEDLPAPYAV